MRPLAGFAALALALHLTPSPLCVVAYIVAIALLGTYIEGNEK